MARSAREAIPHHQTACAVQTLPHCWNSSKGMLTKQLNLLYKVDYWRRKMSDKNWHSLDIFIGELNTHFISLEFRWKNGKWNDQRVILSILFFIFAVAILYSASLPSCCVRASHRPQGQSASIALLSASNSPHQGTRRAQSTLSAHLLAPCGRPGKTSVRDNLFCNENVYFSRESDFEKNI